MPRYKETKLAAAALPHAWGRSLCLQGLLGLCGPWQLPGSGWRGYFRALHKAAQLVPLLCIPPSPLHEMQILLSSCPASSWATLGEGVSCLLQSLSHCESCFVAGGGGGRESRETTCPLYLLLTPSSRSWPLPFPLHLTDLSNVQLANLGLLYAADITSTSFQLYHSTGFCYALSTTW